MSLSVTYFGMTAETTGLPSERFEKDGIDSVGDLRNHLLEKYPKLKDYEFKIVVDSQVVEDDEKIGDGALIALLPPFAGG
jgi:sulfur-carrier protein